VKALNESTWPAFAELVEANNRGQAPLGHFGVSPEDRRESDTPRSLELRESGS